jgi:hypothetical protein
VSVTKYQRTWIDDEDPFESVKQKNRRAQERDWKQQVQEELDEMEDEDE